MGDTKPIAGIWKRLQHIAYGALAAGSQCIHFTCQNPLLANRPYANSLSTLNLVTITYITRRSCFSLWGSYMHQTAVLSPTHQLPSYSPSFTTILSPIQTAILPPPLLNSGPTPSAPNCSLIPPRQTTMLPLSLVNLRFRPSSPVDLVHLCWICLMAQLVAN